MNTAASPSAAIPGRKWLGLLLLVIACAGVLAIVGAANPAPSRVQRPADIEAERFADENLLEQLNVAAAGKDAADGDRGARVEAWLQSMTGKRVIGSYESILVGPRNGESFPVAVYSYWEDKSFSGSWNHPYYGRACGIYAVGDQAVTFESVDCPETVPEQPSAMSLVSEGWLFG